MTTTRERIATGVFIAASAASLAGSGDPCSFSLVSQAAIACVAPSGAYRVERRIEALEGRRQGVLTITNTRNGNARRLYAYERSVSIVWSPDSRHLVLNDYGGSDYTNNFFYDSAAGRQLADIKRTLLGRLTGKERGQITGNDHVYLSGYQWLDGDTVAVIVYGHGDHDRRGFCRCHALTLSGRVGPCTGFAVPRDSDPEEYCDKMSR
jgi:hypothetical protein